MSQDIFSFHTFVHALAGSLGGVIAMATFYPFETVRSRIQVEDSNKYLNKSTFSILCELAKVEGFATLYRGMKPVLLTVGASTFVYFYAFHGLKTVVNQSAANDLLIGIIAGVVNVFVTCPMWVVTSRLKMKGIGLEATYTGLIDGIFHIARSEGLKKLWSGLMPSLVLVSNPAIQFMVYETLKRNFLVNLDPNVIHSIVYFSLGAIAKTIATIATYPLQVIQTRLRYGIKDHYDLPPNAGSIELFFYIIKRQGIQGLFTGLEAKLLQTVLTAALMFVMYEKIANFVFYILRLRKQTI